MNTHKLLYATSRTNPQTGIRLVTQEYIVGGYSIILRVRMSDDIGSWACMIGLMTDALSNKHVKVREFDIDFIRQYVRMNKIEALSSHETLLNSPTEAVQEELKPLFDKLLDIANELTLSHELTFGKTSDILSLNEARAKNADGDTVPQKAE